MNLEEIISIVTLKKIDENKFEGQNYHTSWGTVFGGQTLSQSLHAAYQTVPDDRNCSLYACLFYFAWKP
jgi:acyl-CoA thioesterase-2